MGWIATAGFVAIAPAAVAAGAPEFEVQPTATTAGTPVTVSGSCPNLSEPHVFAFLQRDASQLPYEEFGGHLRPSADANGAFSTSFPVPADAPGGIWRFELSCSAGDVVYQGPDVDVTVTPGPAEHLTVQAGPAVAGEQLDIAGTGCKAQGRALDRVETTVYRPSTYAHATLTAAPNPDGTWAGLLSVPPDFPPGDAVLSVSCQDMLGEQPSWQRYLATPISIAPGEEPSTAPPDTRFTPDTLARTGFNPRASLFPDSMLLIILGVSAVALARRRERTGAD